MSIDFAGSKYIKVTGTTDFNFNGTTNFTISLWLKTTDNSHLCGVLTNNDFVAHPYYSVRTDNGQVYVVMTQPEVQSTKYAINDGLWHNIVVVRDISANKTRLYIDGIYKTEITGYAGTNYGGNQLIVAAMANGGYPFYGTVGEVKVYNSLLTQARLNSNMHRSIVAETGLVGYWRLDEGKINSGPGGKTAVDLSGRGNHCDDYGDMSDANYKPAPPITMLKSIL